MLREMLLDPAKYGISTDWEPFFREEMAEPYFQELDRFVEGAYSESTVYPPRDRIFAAYSLSPLMAKCVICGQDPYYRQGQATGLAFALSPHVKETPSMRNIRKELRDDLGEDVSQDLSSWPGQGVFLINSVLTVEDTKPMSHSGKGWERFTADSIEYILKVRKGPVSAILWGSQAGKMAPLFKEGGEAPRMAVLSPHPSPLSAYRGFFGSKPFSRVNSFLFENGEDPIIWGRKA
ncbi:MAG: uracil-DNA glycosylase [Oscillospiraceae bacterium]|jgi:uracil-DNA glycosylase